MKTMTLAVCLALAACTATAHPAQKRIDSLMDYYAETFRFNGVAFVSVGGQTLLHKGYGYKDAVRKIPNDRNTLFQIGSVTKQFTAEIILMLAKEGRLGLQDRLSKYFPGYPSGDSITIEHLLTHTSGLYNYTDDTLWSRHPGRAVSQERMLAIFRDKPLAFSPGSQFEYCNSNYMLLSYIIERIEGKPYSVVARERILSPLGMIHSGFDFLRLASRDKAVGYNCVLADSFRKDRPIDSTLSWGAGGMYSTAADLYQWHRALQSYRLLDKAWQQKAYQPFKGGYAYGWMTGKLAGKDMLWHSGGINGFSSHLLRIEDEDVCIIVLSNVYFPGANVNAMAKNLVRCLYDSTYKVPHARKEIRLAGALMRRYEGTYVLSADTSLSLTMNVDRDRLMCTITGQPRDRIYPQSERMFFARTADAQFEFVPEAGGGYKLVLHQHGQQFEAMRRPQWRN